MTYLMTYIIILGVAVVAFFFGKGKRIRQLPEWEENIRVAFKKFRAIDNLNNSDEVDELEKAIINEVQIEVNRLRKSN